MKPDSGTPATPVQLNAAFWPLFMTSRVMVRFIGSFICFAVADEQNKLLLVYAHDEAASTRPPSLEAISRAFPVSGDRARAFGDPRELPLPYSEIRTVHSALCYTYQAGNRKIMLLVPGSSTDERSAQERFFFINWARPDQEQVQRVIDKVQDEFGEGRIHVIERNALQTRVLVQLPAEARIDFLATGLHLRARFGVSEVFPVHCECRTA